MLLGPALMVAAALIVKGYTEVGDGFSAGVIVALAVALRYIALGTARAERALPILRHAPASPSAGCCSRSRSGSSRCCSASRRSRICPRPGEHVVTIGTLELITPLVFDVGVFLLVVRRADVRCCTTSRRCVDGERPMNLAFALAAAVLFGCGAYLLLKRDLRPGGAGVVLISQCAVLTLIASSLTRGAGARSVR